MTEKIILDRDRTPHIVNKLDDHRERYANRILPTLEDPDEIWMVYYNNGQYRKRYIKYWGDRRGSLSIVSEDRDGGLLYNFMSRKSKKLNNQRQGTLLYPKNEDD